MNEVIAKVGNKGSTAGVILQKGLGDQKEKSQLELANLSRTHVEYLAERSGSIGGVWNRNYTVHKQLL